MQVETMKAMEAVKTYKKQLEHDMAALHAKYISDKDGAKKHLADTDRDIKLVELMIKHLESTAALLLAFQRTCQGLAGANQSYLGQTKIMLDTLKKQVAAAKAAK